jgi:hypothetical protein
MLRIAAGVCDDICVIRDLFGVRQREADILLLLHAHAQRGAKLRQLLA